MSKSFWIKGGVFCVAAAGAISSFVTIGEFVSGSVNFGNWSVDARIVRWILLWTTCALGIGAAFIAGLFIKGTVQFLRKRKLAKKNEDRQQAERQARDTLEKAKRQRKYILSRFDWLLQWHSDKDSSYERSKGMADKAAEAAQSIEFTADLERLNLINPKLIVALRADTDLIVHLAGIRKKYELRGLESAQEVAKRWKLSAKRKSKIDTSVD